MARMTWRCHSILPMIFCALLAADLSAVLPPAAHAADMKAFTSDGCSLFPDGTPKDRAKWCECCLLHDIAYWQGGSEEDRNKADRVFRDCLVERTKDTTLADAMYLGVRSGGHPVFPTWYRWAYGWPYGRLYEPLSDAEKQQVREKLVDYYRKHPTGYCKEEHSTSAPPAKDGSRPATWAQPVAAEHLKNFYRLDGKVYRSAQPNKKSFRELQGLGIRNVLSFRDYHSDDDGKKFGLNLYRVRMEAGDIRLDQVIEALRIIKGSHGPILIHCWHGSDRTGLVSALYRIVFQGWSKDDAIDELMHGGYGYHELYKNIPEFIRQVDINLIQQRLTEEPAGE